ncbi:MAG: ribosome maturation factor RimM [bacterium]
MSNDTERVTVGTIVKPHGVHGEVIVEFTTDFPEHRFAPGQIVRYSEDGQSEVFTIESARPHQDRLIVEFEEIDSIDQAEAFRDYELYVRPDEVFHEEGSFYDFDLIGMTVYDQGNHEQGVIEEIYSAGGHQVLVIHTPDDQYMDFPAQDELVREAELDGNYIKLEFPENREKLTYEKG